MPDIAKISKRLRAGQGPQPPGNFSFGSGAAYGGPRVTDAYGAKPAPSALQLVENYGALIYAMVARNRNAVARIPMRLLADGSRTQGKPSRACDPIKVSRTVGRKLATEGKVSTAAVDQVYEIRDHPLLDLIDNPDPYGNFTREKLIGLMVSYMDVVGSGFLIPEGNGWDWRDERSRIKGPPEYLWVLYSQYTIPIRVTSSPIVEWFQYFSDRIPRDGTMWFRHNHSLRDPYGAAFSPTYAGESYRRQEQEQIAIFSQVLGLGPRPNMIASAKDANMPPGRDEAIGFAQDLVRKQAAGYAGGILINTGAWDFTPVSYSPTDLAGKDISEYDLYRLAAIFDQPPTYYTVDSNLANLQAADKQHARQGVEPRCKTIAGQFTHLAKMFDPRLMFAFDPATDDDELAHQQVVDMQLKSGQLTINEVNEELKYDPKTWGDEPWLPGTLVQPSMAQEKHDQALEQGKAAMDSMGTQDGLAVDGQDHQKKMDKAGLDLQKKELDQKAKDSQAKQAQKERAIMELAEGVLNDVRAGLDALQVTR